MKAATLAGLGLVYANIFSLESVPNRDGWREIHVFPAEMLRSNGYQQSIAAFFASDVAKLAGSKFAAKMIVSTILKDLGRGA
jgi:hypothetical protein